MGLFYNPNFYYISLALQAICAIHCIKKGNQQKWIWIIVCLPFVGCLAYVYTEMFSKSDMQKVQGTVGTVFNPTGTIKKLEANLKFSDTFNNKVALADAYLQSGNTVKAVELYESCLTGTFTDNEYVNKQLVLAYTELKRYADVIPKAKTIYNAPQFQRSKAHTFYAIALSKTGNKEAAENEFKLLKGKFSNYESRYYYALFLIEEQRNQEAKEILSQIILEVDHLSSYEKRQFREWFSAAKEALKKK